MTIQAINSIGNGRYIIHYEVPSACGCSFTRGSLVVYRKTKPSENSAKMLIQDELKNKG